WVETVVNSSGTVKPVRTVSVGAFVSGPIYKIYVDFNSVVSEGELIAEIDPRLLDAAFKRDQATLQTQQAERNRVDALRKQAERNYDRAKKLRETNKDYISETEMDQYYYTWQSYEAQLKLADANIEQARAGLKNSETNLGYTKITAPEAGIVIDKKVNPGQPVASSYQTRQLFTIAADLDCHMYGYPSRDD